MSFLSNVFRPTPKRNQWPFIVNDISRGFQNVKIRWFDQCVIAMDLGLFLDGAEKVKVVHTTLNGPAALAITGYQLCCAKSIIAENTYIPKSSLKDFVDLLSNQTSGGATAGILQYLRRYDEVSSETSTQLFRLGTDVARYIIDQEPTMIITLHIASLAQMLIANTSIVLANAFGDSARVDKLSRQIALSSSGAKY